MASSRACRQCLLAVSRPGTYTFSTTHRASRFSSALRPASSSRSHHTASSARPTLSQKRQLATSAEPQRSSIDSSPYASVADPQRQRNSNRAILRPNQLFNPLSSSPVPDLRRRAAFIKQQALCPHPAHRPTRQVDNPQAAAQTSQVVSTQPPAHVKYECPDCGIPVYCCEEHWVSDYENHLQICDTLRQINEDDHDLHSGRFFPEFDYPGPQIEEAQINMTNWDTLLYTREFQAINAERSLRQATRLLTYPVTIGSVLHDLSPYNIRPGGRLTVEGLKSLSALRYNLHPPRRGEGPGMKDLRTQPPPVRIFVLGARAESSLPRDVWIQLAYMFKRVSFNIIFIGPESMVNRDDEFPLPPRTPTNPFGAIVEDRISHEMKITTFVDYYHTLHRSGIFYPFDPYFDCFVLYHPGLGHPASSMEWAESLPLLLETKVPIICTGYTEWDMQRDLQWVEQQVGGEMDLLLEPGENRFRSLRWDLNDLDPQDISSGNWGVWAFRGKRYEATRR